MNVRRALVIGASGLVGRAVTDQLLADATYVSVATLTRRPIVDYNPRLMQLVVDYDQLSTQTLPPVDDVFCCLGTTIKVAGSRDAFRKVDHAYVVESLRAAQRGRASRLALVSASGANPRSKVFYSRVKGEVELDVCALGYAAAIIARPSLLIGERAKLGQPGRPIEQLAQFLRGPLSLMLPPRLRPIEASSVARAMIRALKITETGVRIVESDELARLGEIVY